MKFKVVSEKSLQPIGFGRSILRILAHLVDGLVVFVGFLWPLWDHKRQTIADKIMRTVCVPVQRSSSSAESARVDLDHPQRRGATNVGKKPCGKWPMKRLRLRRTQGESTSQVERNAKQRVEDSTDNMARELLKVATSAESEAVKLKALRDALDRAGLGGKQHVEDDKGQI